MSAVLPWLISVYSPKSRKSRLGVGMTGLSGLDGALSARPAVGERDGRTLGSPRCRSRGGHPRGGVRCCLGERSLIPGVARWPPRSSTAHRRVEGCAQPSGFEAVPADLRVDHVYLVSCKNQSKILHNSSPTNLFDRRLSDRTAGATTDPWSRSARLRSKRPQSVRALVHRAGLLPPTTASLTPLHVNRIRGACGRHWPAALVGHWEDLSLAVASASVERWKAQIQPRRGRKRCSGDFCG